MKCRAGLQHFFWRGTLMVVIVSAIAPIVDAQTSSGSSRVVSPTTVAYWQQHDNGDGTGSLDLLVLWRGTPGWFLRGSGTYGGGGMHGGFGQWQAAHSMTYGDITLTLGFRSSSKDFDPANTIVTVLDRDIALQETNVVMIDGVDSGTASIVGTAFVQPRFTGNDTVATIVKRTPELFAFLQCDTLPAANQQAMMALVCGQMRP